MFNVFLKNFLGVGLGFLSGFLRVYLRRFFQVSGWSFVCCRFLWFSVFHCGFLRVFLGLTFSMG